MKHGSFFTGIGGFDLAARWHGWENVFQVEKDKFCLDLLQKRFKEVPKYEDIREFDGTKYRGAIDIVSGGFPCQPFSQAGKKKGEKDDRYLWPEFLRVIREIQPLAVVGENVFNLVNMEDGQAFERILSSLEGAGYAVQPLIIPASSVEGWHERK